VVRQDDDVIFIAQKMISKAENRYADLEQVIRPSRPRNL
jgi:F420-0:gamma-glutamyl ligase